MPSLIEQLQHEALDRAVPISDLLRKAKVVATKLDRGDAIRWVDDELNGYQREDDTPEYRRIVGHPRYLNPYNGWQEIQFENQEAHEKLTRRRLREPVSELEALLLTNGDGQLGIPFTPSLSARVKKAVGMDLPHATVAIERSQLTRVLDSVRSRVLDWALALEKAGVRGEGDFSFSPKDREAAAQVTYNIGTVVGSVGPVGGHATVNATQVGADTSALLSTLADQFLALSGRMALPPEKRDELQHRATELRAELARPEPNPTAVGRILGSVKSIAEIAAGDLVASGILYLLSRPQVAALIQRAIG